MKEKINKLIQQAEMAYFNSQFEDAYKLCSQAIELDDQCAVAYFWRADVLRQLDRNEEALQDDDNAIKWGKHYALAYAYRGYTKQCLGKIDEAAVDFKKAIELATAAIHKDSCSYDDYRARAIASYWLNEIDQAITDLTTVIQKNPTSKDYDIIALAYAKIGQNRLSIQNHTQAIKLQPQWCTPYSNRGDVYYDKLKLDASAIEDFTKVIILCPQWSPGYLKRANAYSRLFQHNFDRGHTDLFMCTLAMQDYNNAIEFAKEDEKADCYYERGRYFLLLEEYKLALQDFTRCIQIDSNYLGAHLACGLCYLEANDLCLETKQDALAIQHFTSAIRFSSQDKLSKTLNTIIRVVLDSSKRSTCIQDIFAILVEQGIELTEKQLENLASSANIKDEEKKEIFRCYQERYQYFSEKKGKTKLEKLWVFPLFRNNFLDVKIVTTNTISETFDTPPKRMKFSKPE